MSPKDKKARPSAIPVRRAQRELGEHLSTWRKLRGLTQAQLSERAGIGVTTVKRLERGDGGVGIEPLFRALRALGILENLTRSLDPYESDVGRLRSDENLPARVRPRPLGDDRA
jgi:transcriptional regulator with XRE-family HTH domain